MRLLRILCIALCLSASAVAQSHGPAAIVEVPKDKEAKLPSEKSLAGIQLWSTRVASLRAKFGEPKLGERSSLLWTSGGATLRVWTVQDGKTRQVDSVSLSGMDSAKFGGTSRGLRLGGTIEDIQRVYGERFYKVDHKDGSSTVYFEWSDNRWLIVGFNKAHRVRELTLRAGECFPSCGN